MRKIVSIVFFNLLFFSVFTSAYAGLVPCGLSEDDPEQPGDQTISCTLCHLFVMIDRILDFLLFQIVPPLAVLMIAVGGFMYIFAPLSSPETLAGGTKGGPAMLSQAKKLLTSVVYGLLIIYGAWVFINTFFAMIGLSKFGLGLTGPDKWFIINCQ